MESRTKLFLVLWLAGMAGVLSFLFVDLSELIAQMPIPAGKEVPVVTPALKLLSLVQPAVILSIAVLAGTALASKVGLRSPVAEAIAGAGPAWPALQSQIAPGLWGGLAGGLAIVLTQLLWIPFLPPEVMARSAALAKLLPLVTRLLYGGITEELLLRWGLMTLLVWAAWRVFQRRQGAPKPVCFAGAILISSVVFGLGHLPLAFLFFPNATAGLIANVIVVNSLFGLVAGYLYWKKGLESAVVAHMGAHIVMLAASSLGLLS